MPRSPYYRDDLAWIHHAGYSGHVEAIRAGIVSRLRAHGLKSGDRVIDVGCGSGLLARALLDEGYTVQGVDASPAMVELARNFAPAAAFDVVRLPSGRSAGEAPALQPAAAVVSTGHVLNYLDSHEEVTLALTELAAAVRPGGLLLMDLMTERFAEARDLRHPHAQVADDWAIVTRFSRPVATRYDRHIVTFRRVGDSWRRDDEHHRNVTFEAGRAAQVLQGCGLRTEVAASFGDESLPVGLVVLAATRSR